MPDHTEFHAVNRHMTEPSKPRPAALLHADSHMRDIGVQAAVKTIGEIYAEAIDCPAIVSVYNKFRKNTEYRTLRDELNLVRATLTVYLQLGSIIYKDETTGQTDMVKMVQHMTGAQRYIESIRALVRDISEMEHDSEADLNVEQLVLVLSQVVNVIESEVTDPDQLMAISKRLAEIRIPGRVEHTPPVITQPEPTPAEVQYEKSRPHEVAPSGFKPYDPGPTPQTQPKPTLPTQSTFDPSKPTPSTVLMTKAELSSAAELIGRSSALDDLSIKPATTPQVCSPPKGPRPRSPEFSGDPSE